MGFQCLVSVLQSLEAWTSKEGLVADQADQAPFADDEEEASNGPVTEGANNSEAKDETKVNTQAEDFEKAKAHKLSMETAVVQVSNLSWMVEERINRVIILFHFHWNNRELLHLVMLILLLIIQRKANFHLR